MRAADSQELRAEVHEAPRKRSCRALAKPDGGARIRFLHFDVETSQDAGERSNGARAAVVIRFKADERLDRRKLPADRRQH